MNTFRRFLQDETAATMPEYGIMIALIAAICVLVVTALGTKVQGAFQRTEQAIPGA